MKLSRYNNEAISYNYKKKSIIHNIFMKEFIFLLKNKILPTFCRLPPTHKTDLIFTASPWIPC